MNKQKLRTNWNWEWDLVINKCFLIAKCEYLTLSHPDEIVFDILIGYKQPLQMCSISRCSLENSDQ